MENSVMDHGCTEPSANGRNINNAINKTSLYLLSILQVIIVIRVFLGILKPDHIQDAAEDPGMHRMDELHRPDGSLPVRQAGLADKNDSIDLCGKDDGICRRQNRRSVKNDPIVIFGNVLDQQPQLL